MIAPDDDARLQAAFDDLKEGDARVRSTYGAVAARMRTPRTRLSASPVVRLAAAIVVIVASFASYRKYVGDADQITVPSAVVALGAWRPATDVLLTAPAMLLRTQAEMRASMIDVDSLTSGVLR
ncbi:MAG: hypothetical protein ABI664_07510 [bacterium]